MTTSFAQLGIKIDATDVVNINKALDNLSVAAKKAQDSTKELERTSSDSAKANKNLALSYEMMISKLTQSGSVHAANQLKIQGYANEQISLIEKLIRKNNDQVEALKMNAQFDKQILEQKSANYKKYINDVADGNAHLLRMEKERLSQEEFAIKASYNARKVMYENLFKEQQSIAQRMSTGSAPTSFNSQVRGDISAGMSQAGRLAQDAKLAAEANNKLAESSKNAAHAHGLHEMSIGALIVQMAKMMAIYRGINFAVGLPRDILEVNMRMETLRVQLEGITGSAKAGLKVFQDMVKLDIKTPFDLEGLTKTWIMFRNFGLEPTEKVMSAITNSVARIGGGTAELIGIGRQLGQAWSKDKLQLVDMKPMIERGLPVLNLLSERLKVTTGDILNMSKAGTLNRDVMTLLIDEMEKWGKGQALRQMDTMRGALSNITSGWMQFEDALLTDKGGNNMTAVFKMIGDTLFYLRDNISVVISVIEVLAAALAAKLVIALMASVAASKAATLAITENAIASLMLSQNISKAAAAEVLRAEAMTASTVSAAGLLSVTTGLNLALAAFAGFQIGTALYDSFEEVRISAIGVLGVLDKLLLTRQYIIDSRKVSGAEQDALTKKYYEEKDAIDARNLSSVYSILNGDANKSALKGQAEATAKLTQEMSVLTAAESEESNLSKVALNGKIKDFERVASFQVETNKQLLNDNNRLHENLKITDEKYISDKLSLTKSTQDINAGMLQSQYKQVKEALDKEIELEKKTFENQQKISKDAAQLNKKPYEEKQFKLGDSALKLQEQLAEIDSKIKSNSITNQEELNKINDESNKLRLESDKLSYEKKLNIIDSISKAEQIAVSDNIAKLNNIHAMGRSSEIAHIEAVNKARQDSIDQQRQHIQEKIDLVNQELATTSIQDTPINSADIEMLNAYSQALSTKNVHEEEGMTIFNAVIDGKERFVSLTQQGIEELNDQLAAQTKLTSAESDAAELPYEMAANNDVLNESKGRTYELQKQLQDLNFEMYQLQTVSGQEELKMQEEFKHALEAKADLIRGINIEFQTLIGNLDKVSDINNTKKYTDLKEKLAPGVKEGDADTIKADKLADINFKYTKEQTTEVKKATEHLDSYISSLDNAKKSTLDLKEATDGVFGKSIDGIQDLSNAFTKFSNTLINYGESLKELGIVQATNDNQHTTNLVMIEEAVSSGAITSKEAMDALAAVDKKHSDNAIKLKIEEQKLDKQALQEGLQQASALAGAASKMFEEKSSAAKAFHSIEVGLAAASMALKAAEMAMTLKATVVSVIGGAAKFFEQSGWAGFAGVAAMMAVLGGLGYAATTNFGSENTAPEYSKDTGTVLGDTDKQSESLANTNKLLKDIHADEYAALRSIDSGINSLQTGITNTITSFFKNGVQSFAEVPAPTNALPGGNKYGSPIHQAVVSFLFGGKQTSSVIAQGIMTEATAIAEVMAGGNISGKQFATIETKTKGGLFSKDKVSYSQQFAALDSGVQKGLNGVFTSMGNTMIGLADTFGDGLSDRVRNYIIPALSVDLKGLTGEEATKKLNSVISATLDNMATDIFGGILAQYQQLGEGMLETAVRIVAEMAVVEDALKLTGHEITGDAIAVSDALVQAAGGLKEFQQAFENFYDKFFTDSEKHTREQTRLQDQLGFVGLKLADTREGYRKLVESLDINNEADQERYATLLKLSDAADEYYKYLEAIAAKQRELDIQLTELTGDAVEALAMKRRDELAVMDASLQFTQKSIWLLTDANTAVNKAMSGVTKAMSDLTSIAAKLRAALATTVIATNDSLRNDRIAAMQVFNSALVTANAGGSIEKFPGMEKAITDISKPSEQIYSSFVDYARDQGIAGNALSQLADYADSQVSMAQQQLDAINGTTDAVLSVQDAVAALAAALAAKEGLVTAIKVAQAAGKSEAVAKSAYDVANQNAEDAANNLASAFALAAQTSQAAVADATKGAAATAAANLAASIISPTDDELFRKSQELSLAQAALSTAQAYTLAAQNAVPGINSFAVGINEVPYDMVANIHAGERIMPAADNKLLMSRLESNSNGDLLDEIRALRNEVVMLRAEARATASHTNKTARILERITPDGDAMATRVEA